MNAKKIGIVLGVVVILAGLGGTGFYFREEIREMIPFFQDGSSDDRVYVERVSKIMNQYAGVSNRYNGIVESQDTWEVSVDSARTVDEIHVAVGDVVEEEQTLVSYDTSDIKMQIAQANLEIESIDHDIENYKQQIHTLELESAQVPEAERYTYTTQIQNIQNSIAQREFDRQSKQLEISKYQTQLSNSTVKSKVGGVVKEINEKGTDSNGNPAPFMTILQTGEYRVKGSIDEQNIWTLTEGQPVVIRSRVDAAKTWKGSIGLIDTENPGQDSGSSYAVSSANDGTQMATKYPFYIDLERVDGLILGQHVYIELDEGQEVAKEGLWLYGSYIVQDEEDPYVWAANDKNRLEKRYVELGEYDADMDEYEIISGIAETDYITWPMPGLYEGVAAVTDAAEVDYSSPLYNQEAGGEDIYGTESYEDMELFSEDGTELMTEDGGEVFSLDEAEEEALDADGTKQQEDSDAEVVE